MKDISPNYNYIPYVLWQYFSHPTLALASHNLESKTTNHGFTILKQSSRNVHSSPRFYHNGSRIQTPSWWRKKIEKKKLENAPSIAKTLSFTDALHLLNNAFGVGDEGGAPTAPTPVLFLKLESRKDPCGSLHGVQGLGISVLDTESLALNFSNPSLECIPSRNYAYNRKNQPISEPYCPLPGYSLNATE